MIYKAPNPLDSQMLKAQLVQKMKYIHDTFDTKCDRKGTDMKGNGNQL